MGKLLKFLFSRIVVVSALILLQLALLFFAAVRFTENLVFYYLISTVLAVVLTLVIVSRKDGAEYKIAWLVTVLLIPVFGGLLYLIFSGNRMSEHKIRKMARINEATRNTLKTDASPVDAIYADCPAAGFQGLPFLSTIFKITRAPSFDTFVQVNKGALISVNISE